MAESRFRSAVVRFVSGLRRRAGDLRAFAVRKSSLTGGRLCREVVKDDTFSDTVSELLPRDSHCRSKLFHLAIHSRERPHCV